MVQLFCIFLSHLNITKLLKFKIVAKRPFLNCGSQKRIRSLADIAEHICHIKRICDGNLAKAKSSVALIAEAQSDFFNCNIGVRQGENMSPLLFSIYLHDLKSFISRKCNGLKDIENMQREHLYEEFVTYFKLYILLYADDTVILAENPEDLQASLDEMKKYCDTFDLHINVNKTKILFFSKN